MTTRVRMVSAIAVTVLTVAGVGAIGSLLKQSFPVDSPLSAAAPPVVVGATTKAAQLPEALADAARTAIGQDAGRPDMIAFDGVGAPIPSALLAKASSVRVRFATATGHLISVSSSYAPGDAEGDPAAHCESGIEMGAFLTCSLQVLAPDVTAIVKTKVIAMNDIKAGATMYIVPADQLSTSETTRGQSLWHERSVEVIRNGRTVVYASEMVRAQAASDPVWMLSEAQLLDLAATPGLEIATPPPGEGGCGTWTLPEGGPDGCR